jgi:hypothetical protein
VQCPVQPVRELFGGQSRRLRHEFLAEASALLVGEVAIGRVEVFDEDPCLAAVDVAVLEGFVDQW